MKRKVKKCIQVEQNWLTGAKLDKQNWVILFFIFIHRFSVVKT